jgi:peptidoglycan/LPS O-acetylase OafA/YrhL
LVTEPTPSETVPAPPKGRRLAWLDAMRGFAALCVVFDHMGTLVLQRPHDLVYAVLDTGQYGVFVFFLVSGYIIPASLERKGSVRGFWVSRAFRLYPLYIVAILLSLLAWKTGFGAIHGADNAPKTWVYSLPFMMSNMLDGANVPNVIWTLSFEMVFYLLLTALFTFRAHRHSGVYALAAAGGALALGGFLTTSSLNHLHILGHVTGDRRIAILADAGIFIGLALAVTGRARLRAVGVVLAAGTGLTLLLFNTSYPGPCTGLVILALMFTGTMLYRAEQGQMAWKHALMIAGGVLVLALAAGLWHGPGGWTPGNLTQYRIQWIACLVLAGGTFALGMAVRHKRVPGWLAWLGLVSYSVYLLHPIILNAYRSIDSLHVPHPFPIQVLLAAGILAVVLLCSAATYYFVESPMQKYGHKLSRFLQARFGPDTLPAGPVVTAPDAPAVPAEPADLDARGSNNGADVALPEGGRRSPGGDRGGRVSGGHTAAVRK